MPYIGKSPTGTGVRSRYYFTASGSETTLSGADDSGATLTFTDGAYVDVSLNGIALVAGTDYNTTTANTIGGLSALSASDIVEIVVYDIFTVADTVSAKDGGTFSGAITANSGLNVGTIKEATGTNTAMTIDSSGVVAEPNKEYFHVDLTTAQTGNASDSTVTVDFGGSGTVKYDTKSNFDSANDAYLLDSSDGVYLISFSVGIRSATITTEVLKDAAAQVRVATDGSTFTPIIGSGGHLQNDGNEELGSLTFSGSFIYKATTATTKIDVQAFAHNSGSAQYIISHHVDNVTDDAPTGSGTARCTFLSIARIA
jgi:hypothetical protein